MLGPASPALERKGMTISLDIKGLCPTFSIPPLSLDSPSLAILGFCPALSKATHKVRASFVLLCCSFSEWESCFPPYVSGLSLWALKEILTNSKRMAESCGTNAYPSREKVEYVIWMIMRLNVVKWRLALKI